MKTEEEYDQILAGNAQSEEAPKKKLSRKQYVAKAKKTEGRDAAILLGGLCLVLLVLWIFVPAKEAEAEPQAATQDLSLSAWTASHDLVKQNLAAPRTAKFPWGYSDKVKSIGDGRYLVNAYVDSQNGFGAMLRSRFTAKMKHLGGDQWRCEYLEIAGQVMISAGG